MPVPLASNARAWTLSTLVQIEGDDVLVERCRVVPHPSPITVHEELRIVDTLLKTNTKLIANKRSWEDPVKRQKIGNIAMMLEAALEASDKVGLKLNAPRSSLEAILEILPSLRNPTVNRLTAEGWSAIEVILSEKDVRDIVPRLKQMGAEGIIEYPLNKVVY